MESMLTKSRRAQRLYLYSGFSFFASALAYYIVFRSQLPWPGYEFNFSWARQYYLSDLTHGSYPSFALALSMGLIAIAIFASDKLRAATAIFGIWAIGLLHENAMGTFDSMDVAAGTIGAVIATLLCITAPRMATSAHPAVRYGAVAERAKLLTLMFVTATLATGTSAYEPYSSEGSCIEFDVNGVCIERKQDRQARYLSYAELRNAIKVSEPRALTTVSRIYLYNNFLFANEMNEGIHIIDNTDPRAPQRIAFIEIPGNTEIGIRNDNLYADSYIDLVTLDVSDLNNITEIAREESIFPYNSRQNIPGNINLTGQIDRTRGVVVGYQ